MGLGEVPAYVEISMKLRCRVCKELLEAEEHFYPRAGTRTGYQYECKTCRREINKKYAKTKLEREREKREAKKTKEVPKSEPPPRAKSEPTRKKRQKWNHREVHRKKLLQSAGEKIGAGELIAETARSMTFNLSLIIEQQLRLFYGRQINSAVNKPRMHQVLEDTLFEIKQALGRAGVRMKPVIQAEDASVDLGATLKSLQEVSAARALLGVSVTATQDEIKKAYREKAKTAHPDHNGSTEAMQQLNQAFSLLVEDKTNGR